MTARQLIDFLNRHLELNPHFNDAPIFVENGGEIDGLGHGKNFVITHDYRPERSKESRWEYFAAIFELAGVLILNKFELANGYWPEGYTKLRAENPWWLVKTQYGFIRIGWRKRVMHIDWQTTDHNIIVTEDDVTKDMKMVHAWSPEKAIEYMRKWRKEVSQP